MKRQHVAVMCLSSLIAGLSLPVAQGAAVTMTTGDAAGTTSFNSNLHWSDGLAPAAGNGYSSAFLLRTPETANPYTFAGDSLTLNTGGTLFYKGSTSTITVNALILNGGRVGHGVGGATLTLAGNISLTAPSSIDVTADLGTRNIILTAPITGSQTLTFANTAVGGNGKVTLAVDNPGFSGAIVIASTSVQVGNAGATGTLGTGAVTINNPLLFNRTAALTVANILSGGVGGSITQNGTGKITLSGNNSGYLGSVVVNNNGATGGALSLSHANAIGTSSGVTLNNTGVSGGTGTYLELQNGITVNSVPLSMNSSSASDRRTALYNLGGNNTWGGTITLNGSGLCQATANAGTLTINGNVGAGGGGFTGTLFVRGGGSGTINGTLTIPSATVNKTDAGTWTIASAGSSWAYTQVSAGTLKPGVNNAFPASAVLTMGQGDGSGATLDLNGYSLTVAGIRLNSSGGTKTITSATGSPTLTISMAGSETYGGRIADGAAALNLAKDSAGTQTLSGANIVYTGATTVNNGKLVLSDTTAFANATAAQAFSVATGATLEFAISSTTQNFGSSGGVTFTGAGTLLKSGVGKFGRVSGGGAQRVYMNMTGGLIDVQGGTFQNGGWQMFVWTNNKADLNVASGATFDVWDGNTVYVDALTGGGIVDKGHSGNSPTTLRVGEGNGSGTFSGILRNTLGTVALYKAGTGSQTLSGNNTFTGSVTVNAGELVITTSTALGAGTKSVELTNGTAGDCKLRLDGSGGPITLPAGMTLHTSNASGAALGTVLNDAGDNTINGNIVLTSGGGDTVLAANAGSLTVAGNVSGDVAGGRGLRLRGAAVGTISGNISNGTSALNVQKLDAGTWTLSGVNTYTSTTTIGGGSLLVNGSHTGGGNYNATGGVLGGTGVIDGAGASAVSIGSGGTLAPGGLLTTGMLTIQDDVSLFSGATFDVDIEGTNPGAGPGGHDQLAMADGQTLNLGNRVANIAVHVPEGTVLPYDHTFTIATGFTGLLGEFANLAEGGEILAGDYGFVIHYGPGNNITLNSRKVDSGTLFRVR